MIQAFIREASYQPNEKVLSLYNSFNSNWHERVRKVNDRFGSMVLSYDVWEREWKELGYMKYITIPVPKQLPESERMELLKMKTELIRLVYIIEEKTEHQRLRRETFYKIIFLKVRVKLFFKSLFERFDKRMKSVTDAEFKTTMQVIK